MSKVKKTYNSCLYTAKVMHKRTKPIERMFHYKVFMFYLDLDEIDILSNEISLISRNKFNYFNFRDKEHLQLPKENPDTTNNVRQHISEYIKTQGVKEEIGKIMLLTNLATLGYNFNPVSFYFAYDTKDKPLCSVAEVGNTFLEMKPYFLGKDKLEKNAFRDKQIKEFYVSPFIDHDVVFDFNLSIPDERLQVIINDYQDGDKFFTASLIGDRVELNNRNIFAYAFKFPFITLKVIFLIHYQALKLWLKKIHFHRKAAFPELQKNVYRPYKEP